MYGSQNPRTNPSSPAPEFQQQQSSFPAGTAAVAADTATTTSAAPRSANYTAAGSDHLLPVTVLQRADGARHCHIAAVSTLYPRVDYRSASELNATPTSSPTAAVAAVAEAEGEDAAQDHVPLVCTPGYGVGEHAGVADTGAHGIASRQLETTATATDYRGRTVPYRHSPSTLPVSSGDGRHLPGTVDEFTAGGNDHLTYNPRFSQYYFSLNHESGEQGHQEQQHRSYQFHPSHQILAGRPQPVFHHHARTPSAPVSELHHHQPVMIPDNTQDYISMTGGHGYVLPIQASAITPAPPLVDMIDNSGHDPEKVIEVSPNGRYAKLNTVLGKGAYKVVYKAIDREEGFEVAWNCFQTTKQEFNDLSQEIAILKRVRHPNIINFHDCWYHNMEFVFITELMTSGTLREYIRKLELPNMKIIKRWSRQILRGLTYLHSHDPPIIHRDIKCDNIFINGAHGEVKIGDMGTAKMKLGKKYTVIGTPEFMAPEMYDEKGYNEKVDIYAFGMCLLEMVTGEYPYNECKNAAQIYKKVTQGIKPDCLGKVMDPDVFNLICSCIAPEHERPSAQDIANHPFLAVEPEVVLLTASEDRNHLRLQVVFKGMDKLSVKFEFNVDTDTAEEVVGEMIEEEVLPQQFQQLITLEINRILRDLAKAEEKEAMKEEAQQQQKTGWPPATAQTMTNMKSELDRAKSELAAAHERVLRAEQKAEGAEFRAQQAEERARAAKGEGVIASGASAEDLGSQSFSRDEPRGTQPGGSTPHGTSGNASSSRASSPAPRQRFRPAALQTATNRRESSASVSGGNPDRQPPRSPVETLSSSPIDGLEKSVTSRSIGSNNSVNRKNSQVEWTQELENALPHKEYSDDRPIDELIRDTALATNRGLEKAAEWLSRLNNQDIMTVGDLRDLHDEDWASLGLTVFASRALRNALKGRPASARAGSGSGPGNLGSAAV